MMHKFLTRIFGRAEEINGGERCPTYLYRWTLIKLGKRGVYLHHFVGDDWSRDLHDHPKRFISIGLKGGYVELRPCKMKHPYHCDFESQHVFTAPWIRTFPATHIHRLTMFRDASGTVKDCWTLVIVLKSVREWGFWHLGEFIPWREYVKGSKSHIADKMTACTADHD